MIDKKLNRIKDKLAPKAIKDEDVILTKDEGLYLLRLIKIAEDNLNGNI